MNAKLLEGKIALGRLGQPEDIADAVMLLCTDADPMDYWSSH